MTAEIVPLQNTSSTALQTRLWNEYLTARERAQKSGRIEDGIECGRAWRRFNDLFLMDTE